MRTCPDCDGSGVERTEDAPPLLRQWPCPSCRGSGSVWCAEGDAAPPPDAADSPPAEG